MSDTVSLASLKGGAAVELFDHALGQVLENIVDPNTDPEQTREITLKVSFKPDEERDSARITIKVSSKVAAPTAAQSRVFIAHGRRGVEAHEHDPNQGRLDFADEKVTPINGGGGGDA